MLINDTDNQPADLNPDGPVLLVLRPLRDQYGLSAIKLSPGVYSIGAGAQCDYCLDIDGINELHCKIEVGPEECSVVAVDTRTWVNNRAVEHVTLNHGDRLVLGPIELVVDLEGELTSDQTDDSADFYTEENSLDAQQQLKRLEQLVKQAESTRAETIITEEKAIYASESASRLKPEHPGPWQRNHSPTEHAAVSPQADDTSLIQNWRDELESRISRLTSDMESQQQNLLGILQQQNLTVTEVAERQRAVDNAEQRIQAADQKTALLNELLQDVQQHAGLLLKRESRLITQTEQERARIARVESELAIQAAAIQDAQTKSQNWVRNENELLDQRSEELNRQEATLQTERDQFNEQCQTRDTEFTKTQAELAQQRSEIEQTRQEITARMLRLDQLENDVRNREAANQKQWEQNQSEIQQRQAELLNLKNELDAKQSALESRLAGMAQWEAELLDKQQRITEEKKLFLNNKQELTALETQLSEQSHQLDTRLHEIEKQKQDLEQRFDELAELEQELENRKSDSRDHERDSLLSERETEIQQREAELNQRLSNLESKTDDLDRQQKEITEQHEHLEQFRRDLEDREQRLNAAETNDHSAEQAAAVADQNSHEELEALRSQLVEEQQQLQAQRNVLEEQKCELKQSQEQQDALLTDLEQQRNQLISDRDQINQWQEELNQQRSELKSLEHKLAEDRETLQIDRQQREELQNQIEQGHEEKDSEQEALQEYRSPALKFMDNNFGTPEKLSELKQDYTEDDSDEVYLHCLADNAPKDEQDDVDAESEAVLNNITQTEVEFKINHESEQIVVSESVTDEAETQMENALADDPDLATESEPVQAHDEKDPSVELREALADMFDLPADQVNSAAQNVNVPKDESVADSDHQSDSELLSAGSASDMSDEELDLQSEQKNKDRPELPLSPELPLFGEENDRESDVPLSSMLASILKTDSEDQPGHLAEDATATERPDPAAQSMYQPGTESEAVSPAATHAAADTEKSDENDSIAAYMEKLLERSRNRSGAQSEPASVAQSEEQPAEKVDEQDSTVALEVASPVVSDQNEITEQEATVEEIKKSARRQIDKAATRANIDSLRQVANLSARSAIEVHAWKRLKGRLLGQGILTTICVSSSAAFLVSSQLWHRSSHFTYGWVLLGIGGLAGLELTKSVMLLHKLRSKRNDALRENQNQNENDSTADRLSDMLN